jgi:hypothetical protein
LVLIFVFEGVSCGRWRPILAEFAAVPNVPSAELPATSAESTADVRAPAEYPTPVHSPEHGGPKGPEPTRFGDWERNGRCIDF